MGTRMEEDFVGGPWTSLHRNVLKQELFQRQFFDLLKYFYESLGYLWQR